MTQHLKIKIEQSISIQRIGDLLCNALEGGSNYWYMITDKIEPKEWTFSDKSANGITFLYCYPFNTGGALLINDEKADEPILKKPFRLDIDAIQKGLEVMGQKYPKHFADFLSENDDANTGDIFLQCCIFGECIYG